MYKYAYAQSAREGYSYIFVQEALEELLAMKNIFEISPEGKAISIFAQSKDMESEFNTSVPEIMYVISTYRPIELAEVLAITNLNEMELGLVTENVENPARDLKVRILSVESLDPEAPIKKGEVRILSVENSNPEISEGKVEVRIANVEKLNQPTETEELGNYSDWKNS